MAAVEVAGEVEVAVAATVAAEALHERWAVVVAAEETARAAARVEVEAASPARK